jgi:hypothetical protein
VKEIEPFLIEGTKLEPWEMNRLIEIEVLKFEKEKRDREHEEKVREDEEYERLKEEREERRWMRYNRMWQEEDMRREEKMKSKQERERDGLWGSFKKKVHQKIQDQDKQAGNEKRDIFEKLLEKKGLVEKEKEKYLKERERNEERDKQYSENRDLSGRAKATGTEEVDKT